MNPVQSPGAWRVFEMVVRPHILSIAAAACLVFGWLFDGTFHWGFALLAAADWFVVNLLNRVVDLPEDARNGVPGTAFLSRHGTLVTWGTFGFLGLVMFLGHLAVPEVTLLRALFHAIGLAYNYRLIPWPGGRTRFKEMYALKNTSSGALFVLSVILLPLFGSGAVNDPVMVQRAVWLTVFFFPLELTYEVLYDLRDVDGDREEHIPTFPVVHGARWAYLFCAAAIAVSMVTPLLGYVVGPLRIREMVLFMGALQQALVFLYVRRTGPTGKRVVNVTYLGAGQLASYVAWVLLGLPVFDA